MLQRFQRVQPAARGEYPVKREFVDSQIRLENCINPIAAKEILDGRRIEGVEIDAVTDITINHGLGRELLGYIVTKRKSQDGYFRVTISGNQTIATATTTKVDFDTVVTDTGPAFDTTNNRFTAINRGIYSFTAQCYISTSMGDGTLSVISLRKNGADIAEVDMRQGAAGAVAYQVSSGPIELSVDDYVEVFIRQESGGNQTLNADTKYSWFQGNAVVSGIYDKQSTNDTPDRTLVLRSTVDEVIDLWVF